MDDAHFMSLAIGEALAAEDEGNYGIGAVAVEDGELLAVAHNRTVTGESVYNHAEYLILEELAAMGYTGPDQLKNVVLYTTLEPCPMCWGKSLVGGVGEIVVGVRDSASAANFDDVPEIFQKPKISYIGGELERQCEEIFVRTRDALDIKLGYTNLQGGKD